MTLLEELSIVHNNILFESNIQTSINKKINNIDDKNIDSIAEKTKLKLDKDKAKLKKEYGIDTTEYEQKLQKIINDNDVSITDSIKYAIDEFKKLPTLGKLASIGFSGVLVFINVIINTMILLLTYKYFISNNFDPALAKVYAFAIVATLVAPINEEITKRVSTRQKTTASYFLIFQSFEFLPRVLSGNLIGALPALFLHIYNTKLHITAKKIEDKLGEDSKENKDIQSKLTKLPIILHALFNGIISILTVIGTHVMLNKQQEINNLYNYN